MMNYVVEEVLMAEGISIHHYFSYHSDSKPTRKNKLSFLSDLFLE